MICLFFTVKQVDNRKLQHALDRWEFIPDNIVATSGQVNTNVDILKEWEYTRVSQWNICTYRHWHAYQASRRQYCHHDHYIKCQGRASWTCSELFPFQLKWLKIQPYLFTVAFVTYFLEQKPSCHISQGVVEILRAKGDSFVWKDNVKVKQSVAESDDRHMWFEAWPLKLSQ